MGGMLSMWLIILAFRITQGTAVPETMMEMVQAIYTNPVALASSLGMTRVKRSSWDTELIFEKMNMTYKFKYKDFKNKLKGGVAEIEFADFNRLINDIPVKSAKFVVDVDSPNKFKDGLFNINIEYDFQPFSWNDDSRDLGKVHCETKKDGEFYQITCTRRSNIDNEHIAPQYLDQIDLKIDFSSKIIGGFQYFQSSANNVTFEIDLTNKDFYLLKGVYQYNFEEQNYSFLGKVNITDLNSFLVVNVDDKKYVAMSNFWYDQISRSSRGQVYWNFGPNNIFDFQFLARWDFSETSVKLIQNQVNYLTVQLKPTDRYKYEMWSSGLLIGGGEDHAILLFRRGIKLQYESHLGFIVDVSFDLSKGLYHVSTRDEGMKTFEFQAGIDYTNDRYLIDLKSNVDWFIEEYGYLYRFFRRSNCLHCLSSFKAECNLTQQGRDNYTFDFYTLQEDGQHIQKIHIDRQNFDKLKIGLSEDSINLISNMLNYNQTFNGGLLVEGERKQDLIKVYSNKDWFKTFLIQNIDGYIRKVELNGKELLKFGWKINTRADFQIWFDVKTPSGHSIVLRDVQDVTGEPNIEINYNGPTNAKMKVIISCATISCDSLTIVATGRNAILGDFNIERSYSYKFRNGPFKALGETEISNSPLGPYNIHTEYEFCLCPKSIDWSFLIEDTKFSSGLDYYTIDKFLQIPIFSIPVRFLQYFGFI